MEKKKKKKNKKKLCKNNTYRMSQKMALALTHITSYFFF